MTHGGSELREDIEQRLSSVEERVAKLEEAIVGKRKKPVLETDEFLDSVGSPSSGPKGTLAFAYWLYHSKNFESFNANDIEQCFREARIPLPNVSDTIGKNLRRNYLIRSGEKDGRTAYVITKKGESYVCSWEKS